MRIFIVDGKETGGGQTTDIGQFNSRTGEIRLNHTDCTYDLQGRKLSGMPTKKGVYITNGVKRVIKENNNKDMKNETEQKKGYTAPAMRVIELKHQARLMESSPTDPPSYDYELN